MKYYGREMGCFRKAIFLFVFLIVALPSAAHAGDIRTGLVGHWTLDEESGTLADSTANGNDGTESGGVIYRPSGGRIGGAMDFDGTWWQDRIEIADDNALDMSGDFSISLFVMPRDHTKDSFIAKGSDSSVNYVLQMNSGTSGGYVTFQFRGDDLSTHNATSATEIEIGKWSHVVGVRSGDKTQIFINGVFENETTYAGTAVDNGSPLTIGTQANGAFTTNGLIDDVRIYNRALTAADVQELYLSTCSGPVGKRGDRHFDADRRVPMYCNGRDWVKMANHDLGLPDDGLVLHLPLDEDANDASGNGFDGTFYGGMGLVDGIIQNAGEYDGTDNRIIIPSSDYLNSILSKPSFSYGLWFKANGYGLSGRGTFISKPVLEGTGQYTFGARIIEDGTDALWVFGGAGGQTPPIPNFLNTWHHLMITVGSKQTLVYIDGVLHHTFTFAPGYSSLPTGTGRLFIGSIQSNTYAFDGLMDDIRIYNRALSADEVKRLAQDNRAGLVGHWKLDEGAGTVAKNSSAQGNDGTINGGAVLQPYGGKVGGALKFDGTSGYARIPNGPHFDFGMGSLTVALWARKDGDSADSHDCIFCTNAVGNSNVSGMGFFRHSNPSKFAAANIYFDDDTNPSTWMDAGDADMFTEHGRWYHFVVVVDRDAGRLHYYRDGVHIDNFQTAFNLGNFAFSEDLDLGARSGHNDNWFNGAVDDVRVYNRALSLEEVENLYYATGGGCLTPPGSAGDIIYNDTEDVPQFCDGEDWIGIGTKQTPSGGGSCSNPAGTEGKFVYNADHTVLQYCNGNNWIKIGQTAADLILAEAYRYEQAVEFILGTRNKNATFNSGLVGHWKLDETSGVIIKDYAGGNDGTWANGPDVTSAGGKIGTALDFDSASSDVVDIGDPANGSLDFGTNSFSYGGWVKSSSTSTFLVNKGDSSGGYDLLVGAPAAGAYRCRVFDSDLDTVQITATQTDDGLWHHVFCVVDRNTNKLRIYYDGTEIGSGIDTSVIDSVSTTHVFNIGARNNSNSFVDGSIDDVRIYGRALSANEVADLYRATAGDYTENEISFENSVVSGYTNPNCTVDSCKIFAPEGGGMTYTPPQMEWLEVDKIPDQAWYGQYHFNSDMHIDAIGTDDVDLILMLAPLTKEICIDLNNKVGVTNPGGDPPVVTGVAVDGFNGVFGTPPLGSWDAHGSGKKSGCLFITSRDGYHFYHVLKAR